MQLFTKELFIFQFIAQELSYCVATNSLISFTFQQDSKDRNTTNIRTRKMPENYMSIFNDGSDCLESNMIILHFKVKSKVSLFEHIQCWQRHSDETEEQHQNCMSDRQHWIKKSL